MPQKTRREYHIFRQKPSNAIEHVRVGSVRLGRALRAAKQQAKFSRDHFFVAYALPVVQLEDGSKIWKVDPESKRYYHTATHPQVFAERKRHKAIEAANKLRKPKYVPESKPNVFDALMAVSASVAEHIAEELRRKKNYA